MKKLIVSDFDNTLFIDEENLKKNLLYIRKFQEAGNIFSIATARSFQSFSTVANKYNLIYDYVILNNGATVLDKNNEIISNHPLDDVVVKSIIKKIKRENYRLYTPFLEDEKEIKSITKLRYLFSSREEAFKLIKELSSFKDCPIAVFLNEINVDITSLDTNKSIAIKDIIAKEKVKRNDVYTIGDGANDAEMLADFNGYAMVVSHPNLSKIVKNTYEQVFYLIDEIMQK